MNAAKDSLFPQEITLGYLEDYSKWDILDDSIQYLGLNVALIEGTFNNYYETKHQASTFKLWVHKDTGVLLKMEEYNKENEVVSSLVTQEIKFNNKSNNTNFQLEIPSGFKVKSK
jgi:outer membrane lipoprotein-sorting protein